jgi:hypothetical protein
VLSRENVAGNIEGWWHRCTGTDVSELLRTDQPLLWNQFPTVSPLLHHPYPFNVSPYVISGMVEDKNLPSPGRFSYCFGKGREHFANR